MSDTAASASEAGKVPCMYELRLSLEERAAHLDYATPEGRKKVLAERLDFQYGELRSIHFLRFALLAIVAFVIARFLRLHGQGQPGWLIAIIMAAIIAYPVHWFRNRMARLRVFTTPVRIARFLGVVHRKNGKLYQPDEKAAETALRDLFELNIPLNKKGKPKKNAVDPYPGVIDVPDAATAMRKLAWTATNVMILMLILGSGMLLDVVFTITLVAATAATWRYRSLAMQPLCGLLDIVDSEENSDVSNDSVVPSTLTILDPEDDQIYEDGQPEDAPVADTTAPAAPADDTTPEQYIVPGSPEATYLTDLVAKFHSSEVLSIGDMQYLRSLFGAADNIPTPEQLEEMLKEQSTTSPAPADVNTTTVMPVAPAPSAAPAAPVSTPAPAPVAPVLPVAPATPAVPVQDNSAKVDQLVGMYLAGEELTQAELALIAPVIWRDEE